MAKGKTKKIQKEEKAERNVDAPQTESKKSFSNDHDIFSEAFKQNVSQFVRLTQEVLTLKGSVEGTNQSDEITKRRNELSEKVEQAATQILKDQISSIESWIGEQQVKYSEQKERIEKAYEENRASLLSTGSFSEEEIRSHLVNIQKKADEKQTTYDNYAALLQRCHNIYN